jgi:membrane associated rhomboid family serine protease
VLLPIGHEDLRGRRWPYITIGIIALNFLLFLATHWRIEQESQTAGEIHVHILLLKAARPDAQTTPLEQQVVDSFAHAYPQVFAKMGSPNRPPIDARDAQMHDRDLDQANIEMAALGRQLENFQRDSVLGRFAFYPYRANLWSYLTACFLHGGWLHLIFNMWFLWLAGTVIEDAWGRVVYPIAYLALGAISLLVHAAIFPHSLVPVIGASGAIAGLIGAFLVRFPKTRIRLMYWLAIRPRTFFAPAYAVLPLWLAIQLFWASLQPTEAGVAYWAHVGGFVFGAAAALALRVTGLEHAVNQAIDAKVGWSADPRIVRASELIGQNQPAQAVAELDRLLREKPDTIEAWELRLRAHERARDFDAQKDDLAALCRLCTVAGDMEMAAVHYDQFSNLGGEKLPKAVWIELCRYMEDSRRWERAAAEYEKLASCYPNDRMGIAALVAAAKIYLRQLNDRPRAGKLFHAADSSPIPDPGLEKAIREGLREAEAVRVAFGSPDR